MIFDNSQVNVLQIKNLIWKMSNFKYRLIVRLFRSFSRLFRYSGSFGFHNLLASGSLSVENSKCTGAYTHVICYKSSLYWLKVTEAANQCAR